MIEKWKKNVESSSDLYLIALKNWDATYFGRKVMKLLVDLGLFSGKIRHLAQKSTLADSGVSLGKHARS